MEFFFVNGTGDIHIIEGTMNAEEYKDILNSSLQESVAKLELSNELIFQQDNDPNDTVKFTKQGLA